jgi:hypothetical protein
MTTEALARPFAARTCLARLRSSTASSSGDRQDRTFVLCWVHVGVPLPTCSTEVHFHSTLLLRCRVYMILLLVRCCAATAVAAAAAADCYAGCAAEGGAVQTMSQTWRHRSS